MIKRQKAERPKRMMSVRRRRVGAQHAATRRFTFKCRRDCSCSHASFIVSCRHYTHQDLRVGIWPPGGPCESHAEQSLVVLNQWFREWPARSPWLFQCQSLGLIFKATNAKWLQLASSHVVHVNTEMVGTNVYAGKSSDRCAYTVQDLGWYRSMKTERSVRVSSVKQLVVPTWIFNLKSGCIGLMRSVTSVTRRVVTRRPNDDYQSTYLHIVTVAFSISDLENTLV